MAKGDELQKVGRAVASRRGQLGMTQQELADAAHVDLKTIYNLESGTRWPIARTRAALSVALKWSGDGLTAIAGGGVPAESGDGTPGAIYPLPRLPARPPIPDLADLPPMFRKLPDDIEFWWDDVARDLESGGVPRTRIEAEVWDSPDIRPEYKHLLIAIFRSGQAAAARGENPNDRTGLTPAPRRHLTGVTR